MLAIVSTLCAAGYLSIYALEAPIRYVLYLGGKDSLILARDALIFGPLALIPFAQLCTGRITPAIPVFMALVAFHSLVLLGAVGSLVGVAYGVKIVVNLLFGFLLATLLVQPGRPTLWLFAALWCVTLLGVGLDKFVMTFPWTGIRTVVGDLNVDVSKDWSIQDTFSRRVAGFTRSSISVAAFLPLLSLVLMGSCRSLVLRTAVMAGSLGAVFLTTQKGSLLAFAPAAALLWLPWPGRTMLLRLGCIGFLLLTIALPFVTSGLFMPHGTGVFSISSFTMRITDTWPDALRWIVRKQVGPFGIGLGGISGGQRVYAPDNFNPADNLFLLSYAYFGAFAFVYLGFVVHLVTRPITGHPGRAATALAIIMFEFGYGAVLSIIEDQSAALFLGAAVGVLWLETRPGRTADTPGHFITLLPRWTRRTRLSAPRVPPRPAPGTAEAAP